MKRAVVILLAAAVMLAGCNPIETVTPSATEQPSSVPAAGGFLNLPVYEFDTWNPLFTRSDSVRQVDFLIYEGLMKTGADLSAQPCLAQNVEVSPDGLTYTFTLREDVSWHDGTTFSARDVDYTVRTILSGDGESVYRRNLENVAAARASGSYSYVITLKEPDSGFPELATFPIVRENTAGAQESKTYLPMGTGPYKYASGGMSKVMKLKANGSYWTGRPANIDEVVVKVLPRRDALTYAFEAREIEAAALTAQDLMTYAPKGDTQIAPFDNRKMTFLGINTSGQVLGSGAVRRAVQSAVDREKMVRDILFGHACVASLPVPPSSWLYDGGLLSTAQDVERARELLEADGWALGEDGIRVKQTSVGAVSLKFSVLVNQDNTHRVEVAQEICGQLAQLGVDADVQAVEYEEYRMRVERRDYEMFLGEVELKATGDLSDFIGDNARYCVYENAEMDALCTQLRGATSAEARKGAFDALLDMISNTVPFVTLYFGQDALIYRSKVKGEVHPVYGNVYANLSEWYANEF